MPHLQVQIAHFKGVLVPWRWTGQGEGEALGIVLQERRESCRQLEESLRRARACGEGFEAEFSGLLAEAQTSRSKARPIEVEARKKHEDF